MWVESRKSRWRKWHHMLVCMCENLQWNFVSDVLLIHCSQGQSQVGRRNLKKSTTLCELICKFVASSSPPARLYIPLVLFLHSSGEREKVVCQFKISITNERNKLSSFGWSYLLKWTIDMSFSLRAHAFWKSLNNLNTSWSDERN